MAAAYVIGWLHQRLYVKFLTEIYFKLWAFQTPREILHQQISFFTIAIPCLNFDIRHKNLWLSDCMYKDIFCLLCVFLTRMWECHILVSHQNKIFLGQSKLKAIMIGKNPDNHKRTKMPATSVVLRLSDLTPWSAYSFSHHKRFWTENCKS